MATFQNGWEGLTSGTTPTISNTGGTSGTAASSVSASAGDTITTSTTFAFSGSKSMAFQFAGPGAGATRIMWAQAEAGRYVLSCYIRLAAAPTATEDIMGIRHASGTMAVLGIASDGKFIVQNAAGVSLSVAKSTNVIPTGQWVRVQLAVQKGTGTTDGYIGYSYYVNNSSTPTFTWESSIENTGTADVANPFIGRSTGRAEARTIYYDTVRGESLASGWIVPSATVTMQNDWEGLTAGTVPTTANTGGTSGTAASSVAIAAGDAIRATDFTSLTGSKAMAFEYIGPGAGATRVLWAQSEAGRYVFSTYFQLNGTPTALEDVMGIRHASGTMAVLTIGTDGKLIVQNALSAGLAASKSTNVLPAEQWIRVELAVRKGTTTTDGYIGYAYFLNNSATPTFTWESSTENTGTADVANPFIGRSTGRAQARTVYYDMIRGASLASGWLVPIIPSNAPPEVTLTASATGIEPGAVQELISTASDPDGTIASVTIAQISGSPTVTLIGSGMTRSYIAPATLAGTTLGFRATAVDNDGATAASTTVTHTIYPATERVTVAGVEQPIFIRVGE